MTHLENRVRKLEQEALAPSEETARDERLRRLCTEKAAELQARIEAENMGVEP